VFPGRSLRVSFACRSRLPRRKKHTNLASRTSADAVSALHAVNASRPKARRPPSSTGPPVVLLTGNARGFFVNESTRVLATCRQFPIS
jgi:hypothetical protein